MMSIMKIKIILGSTREGRMGEAFATWVMSELAQRSDAEYELLDLRDYPLMYYSDPVPAGMLQSPYIPEIRNTWAEKIKEADGFIVITPEYNHSFPAVLKSALDAIYKEWNNKPIGFISYGGAANGSRAVEHLRQVAVELQMAPIRDAIHIGIFTGQSIFNEDGTMANTHENKKLSGMTDQLLWWSDALKTAREKKIV